MRTFNKVRHPYETTVSASADIVAQLLIYGAVHTCGEILTVEIS